MSEQAIAKRELSALPLGGKKVLVRVDYNVPIQDGAVTDATRIAESLPTIKYLLDQKAAVILCAHLGRPKGTVHPKYSLEPVVKKLQILLGRPVAFANDCVGSVAQNAAACLKSGEVLLLENLRFHAEEEKNDPSFAKALASLADFFVQDAFGAVHRAHASTVGVAQHLPSGAGLLLLKEIRVLDKLLRRAEHPYLAILGGAKVSDKIDVIVRLSQRADHIAIGGGMAYTFLKAQGYKIGKSLLEEDKIEFAKSLLSSQKSLTVPLDHVVAQKVEAGAETKRTSDPNIEEGWIGLDIGEKSIAQLQALVEKAKTIFWNGPLGVFEIAEFSRGTLECARLVAEASKRGAFTVVGGGDSIAALNKSGHAQDISHISTGGGASLEFLEGKALPGIEALPNA